MLDPIVPDTQSSKTGPMALRSPKVTAMPYNILGRPSLDCIVCICVNEYVGVKWGLLGQCRNLSNSNLARSMTVVEACLENLG